MNGRYDISWSFKKRKEWNRILWPNWKARCKPIRAMSRLPTRERIYRIGNTDAFRLENKIQSILWMQGHSISSLASCIKGPRLKCFTYWKLFKELYVNEWPIFEGTFSTILFRIRKHPRKGLNKGVRSFFTKESLVNLYKGPLRFT